MGNLRWAADAYRTWPSPSPLGKVERSCCRSRHVWLQQNERENERERDCEPEEKSENKMNSEGRQYLQEISALLWLITTERFPLNEVILLTSASLFTRPVRFQSLFVHSMDLYHCTPKSCFRFYWACIRDRKLRPLCSSAYTSLNLGLEIRAIIFLPIVF